MCLGTRLHIPHPNFSVLYKKYVEKLGEASVLQKFHKLTADILLKNFVLDVQSVLPCIINYRFETMAWFSPFLYAPFYVFAIYAFIYEKEWIRVPGT